MSYCLNPNCLRPENPPENVKFCVCCGSQLQLFERYRAVKLIGNGGFGRTFLAVDEHKPSKPPCVIKQFYPQSQGTNSLQKAIKLFEQEAVRLEDLGKHPQIPALLAYCTQDDRQYLVQEFIDGRNLAQELNYRGTFSEARVRQLLNDLLPVLQFCHERQVIHRDIKPENIILRQEDNQPVLVDFGAAKLINGSNQPPNSGTVIGSKEYMAPEQFRGNAYFASDIYSLGVTCIRLLTGLSPFDCLDAENGVWCWEKNLRNPVSQELISILDKMLEYAPSARYQTAGEVIQDLNRLSSVVATNHNAVKVQPTIQANPTSPPIVSPSPASLIDLELEEVKTAFGNKNQTKNNPVSSPTPTQHSPKKPTVKNIIDSELEELRKKYGNNS